MGFRPTDGRINAWQSYCTEHARCEMRDARFRMNSFLALLVTIWDSGARRAPLSSQQCECWKSCNAGFEFRSGVECRPRKKACITSVVMQDSRSDQRRMQAEKKSLHHVHRHAGFELRSRLNAGREKKPASRPSGCENSSFGPCRMQKKALQNICAVQRSQIISNVRHLATNEPLTNLFQRKPIR